MLAPDKKEADFSSCIRITDGGEEGATPYYVSAAFCDAEECFDLQVTDLERAWSGAGEAPMSCFLGTPCENSKLRL